MLVLHANWSRRSFWFWAESSTLASSAGVLRSAGGGEDGPAPDVTGSAECPVDREDLCGAGSADPSPAAPLAVEIAGQARRHPFAEGPAGVEALLRQLALLDSSGAPIQPSGIAPLRLWLPGDGVMPQPSHRMAAFLDADLPESDPLPCLVELSAASFAPRQVLDLLLSVEDRLDRTGGEVLFGHGLRFWIAVSHLLLDLLSNQRIVPTLVQRRGGPLQAAWHPWLGDAATASRVGALVAAMPGICRAPHDELAHDPSGILEDMLGSVIDASVRDLLRREAYEEAIEGRSAQADPHVAWLSGLLDGHDDVPAAAGEAVPLLRGARSWLASLDETGEGLPCHLLLRLNEPELNGGSEEGAPISVDAALEARWWLSLHLVSPGDPPEVIDASDLWSRDSVRRGAPEGERGSELLLAELGRASRIYPKLERALAESTPIGLFLTTGEAYSFLREHRGVLLESGFHVQIPEWWDQPQSRLATRLVIDSDSEGPTASGDSRDGARGVGLQAIVQYRWQIALGDQPIALDEIRKLAARGVPLVRVGRRWVEVREDDLRGMERFLADHPGGEMTLLEALRLAHGAADGEGAIPITGLEAGGWVARILGPEADSAEMESLVQPSAFAGSLRPYQKAGLSWLAFLDRFGLGACLADDMGLGKTIQLIALLLHEREEARSRQGPPEGPTLLVAPMSVLANWHRELSRFAPELRVHVHHGVERPLGDDFVRVAGESDIVVTTYALVVRDRPFLERVFWRRVCLDEAQHIKNPPTKQTAAIRSLQTRHRVALTGTPVENRLSELWSIMEFCNPGYLGGAAEFRRRFAVPIERHRDRRQAERLRQLVRPFILRRVKTDPNVIADLPPLVETKHFVPLTTEQAALYEQVVEEMLQRVDRAEGIQRRGLVLAALVKLKQICNHPGHFLKETESGRQVASAVLRTDDASRAGDLVSAARSGKSQRLIEMLEEVTSAGDRALLFTQYREMGHLLVSLIRKHLDVEALFLHGGTPAQRRQQLIDRFQSEDPAAPIFVLSLKAGGVGLNLTAASHVFHFDRWWNPAVENQATDRAFRIGQSRTVHVHKLICAGTLEERIDQMIEQKTELAAQIVGSGETWLTELSTGQLRDLFLLRRASLTEDDPDERRDREERTLHFGGGSTGDGA
jgi:SNF2 family DNA or RNA helicase